MLTTTPNPTTPEPQGANKGWLATGICSAILLILVSLWETYGRMISIPTTPPPAMGSYNPHSICPLEPAKAVDVVDASTNNPLGIKYNAFVRDNLNGEDSGHRALDGGTFAKFATEEEGIEAGRKLLRSKEWNYAGKNVEQALRTWSNKGYGANIVEGTGIKADAIVNDLPDDQMNLLLEKMKKKEGVNPTASAVWVAVTNPNDHRGEDVEEFTAEAPHDCFSSAQQWVRPPTNWASWTEEITSNDPEAQVAIWFEGSGSPDGPYTPATLPHDYRSKQWRLQAVGTGYIGIRYVAIAKR